jgi:hypothetical protein
LRRLDSCTKSTISGRYAPFPCVIIPASDANPAAQYPNMAERKMTREQAWNVGGWSDTVQQVRSFSFPLS